jgi:hypothetical protein
LYPGTNSNDFYRVKTKSFVPDCPSGVWWYRLDRPEITEAIAMTAAIDFNAGGYRFKDLLRERIVSSRGNLNYLQRELGFPRPIKTGLSAAWYPKSEVHAWLAQRAALRDRPANPKSEKQPASRGSRRSPA